MHFVFTNIVRTYWTICKFGRFNIGGGIINMFCDMPYAEGAWGMYSAA